MEEKLASIYYDPSHPAAFSGVNKLYQFVKQDGYTYKQISDWLKAQETYTVHRYVKRRFRTNKVIASRLKELYDVDLADFSSLNTYNDGVKYILVMIDILSRFVWVETLKSKKSADVTEAMQKMLKRSGIPKLMRVDKGGEFNNHKFDSLMSKYNIRKYTTSNQPKSNYCERIIKILKEHVYKYISYKQNYRYIDVLQKLVNGYNASIHSSIQMAPRDVNQNNQNEVFWISYWPKKSFKPRKFKFKIGETVRVSFLRRQFMRAWSETFSGEIFLISSRHKRNGIPIYKLTDFYGKEEIGGTFYEEEIQSVTPPNKWRVEKILKTRKKRGKVEHLIRWQNFNKSFDSWEKASDIENYK